MKLKKMDDVLGFLLMLSSMDNKDAKRVSAQADIVGDIDVSISKKGVSYNGIIVAPGTKDFYKASLYYHLEFYKELNEQKMNLVRSYILKLKKADPVAFNTVIVSCSIFEKEV